MGVNSDVGMKKMQNTTYEVVLRITTKAEEDGKTLFLVEVQHGGVFTINPNIPEEYHSRILFVDCATVIFPYARRIVSDLTSEGGFPPLLLEPINFEAIYQQKIGRAA
jgi:preprotein translocase subunit SecB